MRKIIFLDVDGTVVDYENKIPESAVKAIQSARENGHRVYISTGRSKAEVYQEIWDIGLDGMIGGNGSYVEDQGQVVLHQMLTESQCRRIVDWLHQQGLEFYLESNNGLFASECFEAQGQSVIQEYAKRKSGEANLTVRDVFPHMVFHGRLYRDDVNKISFILNDYQNYRDARSEFPDLEVATWGGKGETALFGDFGVKNINKAHAIRLLLQHLGAPVSDTIAVGDARADIPMLKFCAYGVAMGNGGPEIKAVADYITGDVDKDGLWQAFEYLKLIK